MITRLIIFIIAAAIVIGILFFAVRYIRQTVNPSEKTITITQSGEFDPKEININNDEVLKIKNEADVTYTIKRTGSDATLDTIEGGKTSKDIDLADDSSNEIYLAENTNQKAAVVVGTPSETASEPQLPVATPSARPGNQDQGGKATNDLPDTGPGNSFIYPILAITGLSLLAISFKVITRPITEYLPNVPKVIKWRG